MRSWFWVGGLIVVALLSVGCAVTPRVPLDVSRAVSRDTMRVLRTQNVDLYYPAEFEAEARALAERVEGCAARLRKAAVGKGGLWRDRIELLFPDLPFNNAFVMPPNNGDFFSLVPTHWTLDVIAEFGLPPGPDYVACHEIAHYIHNQQTLRTWGGIDRAFGYLLTPQLGLDAWFHEGLATYYEQQLAPGTGRPAWPAWHGLFHAAVAGQRVTGGDLSGFNRQVHVGNHYLYGSHFIAYLVETYGERKLWELVERQGKSFFFPFIVNTRFRRVYGKSLSALIDDFAAHVERAYPVRTRPPDQQVRATLGTTARYARAPDGREAWVSETMDDPPKLEVRDVGGRVLYSSRLTDVLPRRRLATPSTTQVSGLRFDREGRRLYFVALDQGAVFQEARLLELDLSTNQLRTLSSDLGGFGGDISPDGRSYVFVQASAEGHVLSLFDLATRRTRALARLPRGTYLSAPTFAPDGRTILATSFDGAFGLRLFDAARGTLLEVLSAGGRALYDASFVDDDRFLFVGEHEGRFQAFLYERSTRRTLRLSDAPYLVQAPRASGNTVRFLNREGNLFTLDELPLPTRLSVQAWTSQARFLAYLQVEPPPAVPAAPPASDVLDFVPQAAVPQAPAPPIPDAQDDELRLGEGTKPLPEPARLPLSAATTDAPYRAFPRILIPSVRAPQLGVVAAGGGTSTTTLGLYLGGTDALGKHRWGLSAGLFLRGLHLNASAGYLNAQAAPFLWMLSASQLDFEQLYEVQAPDGSEESEWQRRRQRDAMLSTLLALRTTTLRLSAHVTNDYQPDAQDPIEQERTLGGGTLGIQHVAVESTPMSGARRGYVFEGAGTLYPESLGTLDSTLTDLAGGLSIYTPLPFSRRHTLMLGVRARALLDDLPASLLQVGGNPGGMLVARPEDGPDVADYPGLPPDLRFREPLRGFETYPFQVSRIGIVDLRYRYPIIFDTGTATSLYILPSFFLRQIDVELFGAAAASSSSDLREYGHLAVGFSVTARVVWLGSFALGYQLSRRLSDDQALQHVLTLSADL